MTPDPGTTVSLETLRNHVPAIDSAGNLVACCGCAWRQHAPRQQQWICFLEHLPKLRETGDLVLTDGDKRLLSEMHIGPE